ncbi:SDR family oxidoreductase [soil metagenome]
MIDLKGHAAIITGSTLGIGRAIAEAFAAAGAKVVLHGLKSGAEADAAIAACRTHGGKVHFLAADLTESPEQAIPALASNILSLCGKPTILVNNAGQHFDLAFDQMTAERFERTLRLNVTSPYFLTQWFSRFWIEKKIAGRVLFIGSINGRLAEEDSTAYDTSKGAIEMMVKSLAVNLAPKGIRVNGLAPGLIKTPQTKWLDDRPADQDWIRHHTPDGQIPTADSCGPAAVFLCSDAAAHIHGQMLLVDGGMSALQQPSRGDYVRKPKES